MAVWVVKAVRLQEFEVEVEAEDESEAYEAVDGWVADDFEPFATYGEWQFEAWKGQAR